MLRSECRANTNSDPRVFSPRTLSRRAALLCSSAVAGSLICRADRIAAQQRTLALPQETKAENCTLGFSTYGMKTFRTEKAIEAVARIGFDSIEITVWPDWDAAPARMTRQRRDTIRGMLRGEGLLLTSLMEHLYPSKDDGEHNTQLSRLAGVFELANDLSSESPPLVQTVLGGGDWLQERERLRDRLGDWLALATRQEIVLAIKPHRGGVMSRPSEAAWLIEQLGRSPYLGMVYDYSHYAFRDLPLEETVQTSLPYTAHIAVKDVEQVGERVVFRLPGESGTIDYPKLLRPFFAGGYRGDICCEVSGMVWSKPGYDPELAAKQCYRVLAQAFRESGMARPG